MQNKLRQSCVLMLLLLPLLLTGCASKLRDCLPSTPEPLPPGAQQEATPAECLPSCSTNLSNELDAWRRSLILPGSEG